MTDTKLPTRIDVQADEELYAGFFRMRRVTLQHETFAGGLSAPIRREVLDMQRAVAVLLYDPQRDALVLIEQFRIGAIGHARGAWVLELVAGIVEPGESDVEVAVREAIEEAACEIGTPRLIHEYMVAPAATTERIALYVARVDAGKAGGIHGVAEEGEDIRVAVLSADDALREALPGGRINTTTPIIALQWFAAHRTRLRAEWLGDDVEE